MLKPILPAFLSVLLVGSATSAPPSPPDSPQLPYRDWGACPFECCVYGEWEVRETVELHQDLSERSPVVHTLESGTKLQALTGVVITTTLGTARALEPQTLESNGSYHLEAGDQVHILHYLGEGFHLLWIDGKLAEAELPPMDDPEWAKSIGMEVLAEPETEWWVLLRYSACQVGWTKEVEKFAGLDACG